MLLQRGCIHGWETLLGSSFHSLLHWGKGGKAKIIALVCIIFIALYQWFLSFTFMKTTHFSLQHTLLGFDSRVTESGDLGWGLRGCISQKSPDGATVTGSGTVLSELLPWAWVVSVHLCTCVRCGVAFDWDPVLRMPEGTPCYFSTTTSLPTPQNSVAWKFRKMDRALSPGSIGLAKQLRHQGGE